MSGSSTGQTYQSSASTTTIVSQVTHVGPHETDKANFKIVGILTLTQGNIEAVVPGGTVQNAPLGAVIKVAINEGSGNFGNSEPYLQRLISARTRCCGQVTSVSGISKTITTEVEGTGFLKGGVAYMRFVNGCLGDDTAIVMTGFTVTFEIVLGKINYTTDTKPPRIINANILTYNVGILGTVGAFTSFDSARPNDFIGLDVLIADTDLAAISMQNSIIEFNNVIVAASSLDTIVVPACVVINGTLQIQVTATQQSTDTSLLTADADGTVIERVTSAASAVTDSGVSAKYRLFVCEVAGTVTYAGLDPVSVNAGEIWIGNDNASGTPTFTRLYTNDTWVSTHVLPSLDVRGAIGGGVLYMSNDQNVAVSTIAPALIVSGILVGLPQANSDTVCYKDFECIGGLLVATGTQKLVLTTAFIIPGTGMSMTRLDSLTLGLKPLTASTVTISRAGVYTEVEASASTCSIDQSMLAVFSNTTTTPIENQTQQLQLAITKSVHRNLNINTYRDLVPSDIKYVIDNTTIDNLSISMATPAIASPGTQTYETMILSNMRVKNSLNLTGSVNTSFAVMAADAMSCEFGEMLIDNMNNFIFEGRTKITTLNDRRTTTSGKVFMNNANLNIGTLNQYSAQAGFFITQTRSINSEIHIDLYVMHGGTASTLTLTCDKLKITHLRDTSGKISGLVANDTTIGRADLGNSSAQFSLKLLDSNVFLNFTNKPATVANLLIVLQKTPGLPNASPAVPAIDNSIFNSTLTLSGRQLSVPLGASTSGTYQNYFDNRSKFYVPFGSILDYTYMQLVASYTQTNTVEFKYVAPTTSTGSVSHGTYIGLSNASYAWNTSMGPTKFINSTKSTTEIRSVVVSTGNAILGTSTATPPALPTTYDTFSLGPKVPEAVKGIWSGTGTASFSELNITQLLQ